MKQFDNTPSTTYPKSQDVDDATATVRNLLADVPTNIWHPKPFNGWNCPESIIEIDEELLVSNEHGTGSARMKFGKDLPLWDDITLWNDKYQAELDAGLKIGKHCSEDIKDRVISLVNTYRDCFYNDDAARPIRGVTLQ
jgi:hypothetical protein